MSDEESESKSTSTKGKATKVNFVLLKHILEDGSSDFTDQEEQPVTNEADQRKQVGRKPEKDQNCGPTGRYPVLFSKRCKSKSCQTRLSAFPLFSVPEDTEWLSEDEEIPKRTRTAGKRRRRRRSSSELKKKEEIVEKPPEKTKNSDGSRKDFSSEHQLQDTKNPVLLAWIQRKNKLARKNRKEERKEKKAQRAALEEEQRLKIEKFELSEKKVKEWFKGKRKEARKLWRQNHPKVSPFDMALDDQTENSPPPPEYRVVKTFKEKNTSSSMARSISPVSNSSKVDNMSETVNAGTSVISVKNVQQEKQMRTSQNFNTDSTAKSSRIIERPKTAHNLHSTKIKTPTRPKSAKVISSETKEGTNSKLMKSLNYDDWLKAKRAQDKKKIIERRQELIDSHLEAVISKLGKQRVENIMSTKKQVDSGLKNVSRSNTKSPSLPNKSSYKWRNSHNLPRPEPQGCDCPEAEHLDNDPPSKYIPLSPSSQRKKAVEFCEEVNQKCDGLKPSIDKVLAVLDSEMKKCSAATDKNSKTNSTTKAPSLISTTNATFNDTIDPSLPGTADERQVPPRPKSARPTSARPKLDLVDNTSLTRNEARQKIFHDMDVLGLCDSNENLSNTVAKRPDENLGDTVAKRQDENLSNTVAERPVQNLDDAVARIPDNLRMSTVRSNYFDYGTDVEVPSMSELHVPK